MKTTYAEIVDVFPSMCDSCGREHEETREEAEYNRALEQLIKAAKATDRSQWQAMNDLRDWFTEVRIAERAALDKDVVRLWWVRGEGAG